MSVHDDNKVSAAPLRAALCAGGAGPIREALIRLCHRFQGVDGPQDLWDRVYAPLRAAMPELERRDFIMMAGPRRGAGQSGNWIGPGGNIVGILAAPWLGIPATGKPVFLRYHEYRRIEDGLIRENWVMVDMLDLYRQLAVDAFARMAALIGLGKAVA